MPDVAPALAPTAWATSPTDPRVLGVFFGIGAAAIVPYDLAVFVLPLGDDPFPSGPVTLVLLVANVVGAAALMGRLRASYLSMGLFVAALGLLTAWMVTVWIIGILIAEV